jgi:hypothetical protein
LAGRGGGKRYRLFDVRGMSRILFVQHSGQRLLDWHWATTKDSIIDVDFLLIGGRAGRVVQPVFSKRTHW